MYNDPLDALIAILITLFILSIITEKLTQIVRSYPRQVQVVTIIACIVFLIVLFRSSGIHMVYFILFALIDMVVIFYTVAGASSYFKGGKLNSISQLDTFSILNSVRKGSSESENVKEAEITVLSFLIGFGVAIAFNADLIKLFSILFGQGSSTDGYQMVGWGDEQVFDVANFKLTSKYFSEFNHTPIIGFVTTAFFLSFGSKFFHDLLDTLFQVKELRRKLNGQETYKIDDINDFDEYMAATEGDIIQKAIDQNKNQLSSIPGYIDAYVGGGVTPAGKEYFACVDVKGSLTQKPSHIEYTFLSGRKKKIPIMIFENSGTVKPNYGKIENPQMNNYIGSVACSLIDSSGSYHFLTCAHVLTGGKFDDSSNNQPINVPAITEINGNIMPSTWYYGYQDHEYDIALVRPDNVVSPPAVHATPIDPTLEMLGTLLNFRGAASPQGNGYLFAKNVEADITFVNKTVRMYGLIKTTQYVDGKFLPIASGGDSGSLLLDNQKNALGIILGSDDNFTYAISIYRILLGSNLKIN